MEIYKGQLSGILLAVRERLYTTNPDSVISITELVGVLTARGDTRISDMNRVYNMMLQLAGLAGG